MNLSVFEFHNRFRTNSDCAEYLFKLRWPRGFVCPRCGKSRTYSVKNRPLIRCLDCLHETSVIAGTVLHRSKLPLRLWFWGAYLVATNGPGISAMQFHKQVGLSRYEPAFQMLHKIRSVANQEMETPLAGVVQVDETFLGYKAKGGKRGRGAAKKTMVVAAVEVESWREGQFAKAVRMRAVPNGSYRSLGDFIKERVTSGSTIVTDDWKGYIPLPRDGYRHRVVDTETGLQFVHHMFANLKAWIKGTHKHISKKHAQTYLNEFCYRYNGKRSPGQTFERILRLLATTTGPTQKDLKRAGKRGGWVHWNPPHS